MPGIYTFFCGLMSPAMPGIYTFFCGLMSSVIPGIYTFFSGLMSLVMPGIYTFFCGLKVFVLWNLRPDSRKYNIPPIPGCPFLSKKQLAANHLKWQNLRKKVVSGLNVPVI